MPSVLTLNGGSSSIRFAIYDAGDVRTPLLSGKIERIGVSGTSLSVTRKPTQAHAGAPPERDAETKTPVDAADRHAAVDHLLSWLESQPEFAAVRGVGHRVVHGMSHSQPERVTDALLDELKRITPYDPEHLPSEIELIEIVARRHAGLPQVTCFDTAFHRTMPRVATLLPIPHRYQSKGVQRYGFHGLSYTYLMSELSRLAGPSVARGRVILAHLGNGASLAAVTEAACIDTSMGFTPASGLVMSTRTGDLDPGVMSFLASADNLDAAALQTMVTHESGLLGVSGISSDIRDLLAQEGEDPRAADAVALFCYQVKKWIGSFAAALGGLDTLVFAGGIGENAASIRARICTGLGFLGVELHEARNGAGAGVISAESSRVSVRIIRTDEESVIAGATVRVLNLT